MLTLDYDGYLDRWQEMRIAIVMALAAACGPTATTATVAGRGGVVEASGVELGDDGLRGFEHDEPITQSAIEALLPGGKMKREERAGGTTVFTIDEHAKARGVIEGAIEIIDHDPVGVQRQVTIRSPRMRTALGVRPGDRLGELIKLRRVRCIPQSATLLDCDLPGTRFSLRTSGSELSVDEMVENQPDVNKHRDHTIIYITWLGPVRSRELGAQPLERATVTRGGIGPIVRMRVEELPKHMPSGATIRERRVGDDLELVVDRAGRPFLRFETSDGYLTSVIVETPDIRTAQDIRVGDTFGRALIASSRVTCWVHAERGSWHARCDNGDVELVLEPHTGPPPGGGGSHATVPSIQVAADRIVEIRSGLH